MAATMTKAMGRRRPAAVTENLKNEISMDNLQACVDSRWIVSKAFARQPIGDSVVLSIWSDAFDMGMEETEPGKNRREKDIGKAIAAGWFRVLHRDIQYTLIFTGENVFATIAIDK